MIYFIGSLVLVILLLIYLVINYPKYGKDEDISFEEKLHKRRDAISIIGIAAILLGMLIVLIIK